MFFLSKKIDSAEFIFAPIKPLFHKGLRASAFAFGFGFGFAFGILISSELTPAPLASVFRIEVGEGYGVSIPKSLTN